MNPRDIDKLQGKAAVGGLTIKEALVVFKYIGKLEELLDMHVKDDWRVEI